MTNLPAKKTHAQNRVNAQIKLRRAQPTDAIICLLLSLGLVCLLVKPLVEVGVNWHWWGFFCICNFWYAVYGLRKGTWKPDPASGLLIMMGPITFYFFTMIGAWRKYVVYRKGGYGWTLQKLEKDLVSKDLSQGFDFDFPIKHRRKVERLLRACKLTYEQILDEDWARATGYPYGLCMSICDTPENMRIRENLR